MNRTPSYGVFTRTFAHISSLFTCTAWLNVLQRVPHKNMFTCHHVSDRALSLFALTSSSLSSVSAPSLISSSPLSWSSSSMWSEPPSMRTTAHTQNEEYCPVAIHNLLTKCGRLFIAVSPRKVQTMIRPTYSQAETSTMSATNVSWRSKVAKGMCEADSHCTCASLNQKRQS